VIIHDQPLGYSVRSAGIGSCAGVKHTQAAKRLISHTSALVVNLTIVLCVLLVYYLANY